MTQAGFSAAALGEVIARERSSHAYVVAYSGGLDSHSLLHALVQLRSALGVDVRAVHVNHGLHPSAPDWQEHCNRVCDELGVRLDVVTVDASARDGESPEAFAREQRYRAFTQQLCADELLLTAHTSDDQAETVLQRLLRGSGTRGLAAIPRRRELGVAAVMRPLLDFSRADLQAYAEYHRLRWIEDPSNSDTRFTRNFLRHRVLPLLRERFPAATLTLARTAEHLATDAAVLSELLSDDLNLVTDNEDTCLNIGLLLNRSCARRELLLRLWLTRHCSEPPPRARVQELLRVMNAAGDRAPSVVIGDHIVRRYRDRLYVEPRASAPLPDALDWETREPLLIPGVEAPLDIEHFVALGLATPVPAVAQVRFRSGGERIRLAGHRHRKTLKKLLQEADVPPWRRSRIPLLYVDGQLAAVAQIGVAAEFAASN